MEAGNLGHTLPSQVGITLQGKQIPLESMFLLHKAP